MYAVPNQKVVKVNKKPCQSDYMTIHNSDWTNAFISLKRASFGIYLYIASNVDGYTFALSRTDVMDKLKIGKDSYIRGVKELVDKGYLVEDENGNYQFYTFPICLEAYTEDGVYAQKHTRCMPRSVHGVCSEAYTGVCMDAYRNSNNSKNSNSNNKNVADAPTTISNADAIDESKQSIQMDEHQFIQNLPEDEFWKLRDSFFKNPKFVKYASVNDYLKKKYDIKGFDVELLKTEVQNRVDDIQHQKYLDECENVASDSSSDCVEDFDDDDSAIESLSDYINEDEANEILDTFESCGDDKRKIMHFKQVLPKKYGIPESVMKQYMTHDDFINELENIAA